MLFFHRKLPRRNREYEILLTYKSEFEMASNQNKMALWDSSEGNMVFFIESRKLGPKLFLTNAQSLKSRVETF